MRRQLNARAETVNPAAQSLREGEVVASIAGTNLDGRPYELNYGKDERKHLLLNFSPGCPYCVQQAPLWRDVLNKVDSSRVECWALSVINWTSRRYTRMPTSWATSKPKCRCRSVCQERSTSALPVVARPTILLVGKDGFGCVGSGSCIDDQKSPHPCSLFGPIIGPPKDPFVLKFLARP